MASLPISSPYQRRSDIIKAAEARLASTNPSTTNQSSSLDDGKAEAIRVRSIEFERLAERNLIGKNTYVDADKVITTLLRLTKNILDDPTNVQFQSIKSTSKILTNNVLGIKGGQEALVALGFRTKVINFTQTWTFDPASRAAAPLSLLNVLEIGTEIMQRKVQEIHNRAEKTKVHSLSKKEEEEERRKQALASIEDDRLKVKDRAARESLIARYRAAEKPAERIHPMIDSSPTSPIDKDSASP
ncbi:PUG domain [Phaffia rhodozyma]|uniref:PUG domain n=1 Tax=Phaffia rhodozyma TaxID=264483 RepID=A0A0F7SHH1_PHARH|nr:PUG domain [Phaffia rhodozyma]